MTQKTPVKKPKAQAPKPEALKPEKPQPKAVEPKLSDIKLILDALTATVLDHTRQIAELQEALARKRKPVPNGKVQIRDKQTGKIYPSKNNCYPDVKVTSGTKTVGPSTSF